MLNLGGLQWDHTVELAKIRSQQEIALEREETVRFLGILVASVATTYVIVRSLPGLLALWLEAFRRPPVNLLPVKQELKRYPQVDLEWVDGEWCVVMPEQEPNGSRRYFPAEHLLGEKRQIAIRLLEQHSRS